MMSNKVVITMASFSSSNSPPTAAAAAAADSDDAAQRGRSALPLTVLCSLLQPHRCFPCAANKHELWYSSDDVNMMRLEMRRDASVLVLARTLLSPSPNKDLDEVIEDISQVVVVVVE